MSRLQAAAGFAGEGAAGGLLSEVAEALLQAGRAADAASTVQQGLERELSVPDRVAALTMLSRAHFSLGDFHGAAGALDAAAALAEVECPEAVVLPLCRHADAVMMTAGPAAALPLAARARELARKGDESLRALATAKWGMLALDCGDPAGIAAAESAGRELLGASRSELALDVRAGGASVLVPFACAAMSVEHFEEADAAFRAGIEEADRVGNVNAACTLAVPYGLMLLRTALPASLAVAERLLGVADLVLLAEPFARTLRSYAFLELGDEERSVAEAERARGPASDFSIWLSLLWLDHVRGMRLLRHGRFEDASDVYAELEERYEALGIREPCIVPFARHAVVAHARAQRVRDAERVVDWLDERADALPCAWPAAAAAAGRAELAQRRNDHAAADKGYRVAVEHLDGGSMPLELAEVLIEQGNVLRRDGRPREGRESLRRAVELAESGGGVWLARRAGEELAAAGGRRRRRRNADELTPQEQRIARLAATGASDKDIASHLGVSVRTVRTHLEHVFAKLAVHSRRDLMAMGERLDALIGRKA